MYLFKRWVGAVILVAATYNPTGWCYVVWVDRNRDLPASIILLTGFSLMVGFVLYFRKSLGAVGEWGIAGLLFFFAAILWTLSDYRVINLNNYSAVVWALKAKLLTT